MMLVTKCCIRRKRVKKAIANLDEPIRKMHRFLDFLNHNTLWGMENADNSQDCASSGLCTYSFVSYDWLLDFELPSLSKVIL